MACRESLVLTASRKSPASISRALVGAALLAAVFLLWFGYAMPVSMM